MSRSTLPLVAAALLVACDQTSPSVAPADAAPNFLRTTEHSTVRESFDFTGFEDCVGETLRLTGEVKVTSNVVLEPGAPEFATHFLFTLTAHGTAVGEETGTFYRFHEVSHTGENGPLLAVPHFVHTERLLTHLVSTGSQPDAMIRLAFHILFDNEGVGRVVLDTDNTSCPVQGT